MAKKSKTAKKPVKKADPIDIERLKARMLRSGGNIYRVVESMFGVKCGEEIFQRLEAAGIFKCDECRNWLEISELDDSCKGSESRLCVGCMDAMNAE